MEYKYGIGQKVMGRFLGFGTVTFIAGEIVKQFEGIGRSYLLKLEPGITIPEGLRNDGFFPISELEVVPFRALRWSKIQQLAEIRNKHLSEAQSYYEQMMEILNQT